MGRQSRDRHYRRALRAASGPMRVVPSRRGLVLAWTLAASFGLAIGLGVGTYLTALGHT